MKMPPCDWAEDDRYAAEKRALSNLFHRMHSPNFRPPTAPGLTDSETFVLLHIGMAAGGGADIRPSQLARHARMTPSALSQTLKRLEEKGCIVRTRAEGDSRSVSIDVTEKGSELIEQARRLRNDAYSALLDYLGPRDVAELTRVLGRIADFAEQMRKAKQAAGTDGQTPQSVQKPVPQPAPQPSQPAQERR
jgi:DNA-binding MarR family transcriptional regulator